MGKKRLLSAANQAFEKERFDISEALYRRIIEIDSTEPVANYRVGLFLINREEFSACTNYLKTALESNPSSDEYWLTYINALLSNGQLKDVEAVLSTAIRYGIPKAKLERSYKLLKKIRKFISSIKTNQSVQDFQVGKYGHVLASVQRKLLIDPMSSQNYSLLGLTSLHLFDRNSALKYMRRAIMVDLNNIDALNNLGILLFQKGHINESSRILKNAIIQRPSHLDSYNSLHACIRSNNNFLESKKIARVALIIDPNNSITNNNFGADLIEIGLPQKALGFLRKSTSLDPIFSEALNNLGIAVYMAVNSQTGIEHFKKALLISPEKIDGYFNLACCLSRMKTHRLAILIYNRCLKIDPSYYQAEAQSIIQAAKLCDWSRWNDDQHSKFLSKISYETAAPFEMLSFEDNPERQQKRSEEYINRKVLKSLPYIHQPINKSKRLTIGYFSETFREHATTRLIVRLFELHNKSNFVVNAYSLTAPSNDGLCQRIKKSCDNFYDVSTLADDNIALMARSHNLDIAIDLSGFTERDRSNIFALKVAPIQINFLGYPGTMGGRFMDYIIADKTLIPEQSQHFYSEKIIYLPHCYQPQDILSNTNSYTLTRSKLNLPQDAFVFCCFNNSYKIGPNEFDSWANILNKVDGSILWLIKPNEEVQNNLIKEGKRRGISSKRLVFSNRVPYLDYMARLKLADLYLDTFNYNAGATASDALRAGLPLLTKAGAGYAARMASSLLNAIELNCLITYTQRQYEEKAVELANSPSKLNALCRTLNQNKYKTNLFNSLQFTTDIEKAYIAAFDNLKNDEIKNISIL